MCQQRDGETHCRVGHRRNSRRSLADVSCQTFLEFLNKRSAIRVPPPLINPAKVRRDIVERGKSRFRNRNRNFARQIKPPVGFRDLRLSRVHDSLGGGRPRDTWPKFFRSPLSAASVPAASCPNRV